MRKTVAGILIGLGAGATVLAVDLLLTTAAGGVGSTPLQRDELITYDWRLSHTARPETARQDIALVEIDEYSLRNLQPNAGRWPWPRIVHAELLDYLARGPAKVIAYDVELRRCRLENRLQVRRRDDIGRRVGQGARAIRSRPPATSSCSRTRPTKAAPTRRRRCRTAATGSTCRASSSGSVVFSPIDVARARRIRPRPQPVRARSRRRRFATPCRSSGAGTASIPSLGLAAALRVAGVPPGEIRLDGQILRVGDRADAARAAPREERDRHGRLPAGR